MRQGFADSPLYNGTIKSIGPRYCPSIETKLVNFADKDKHQLFLEPEGCDTNEYYLNGFSSSLPWQTQFEALKHIPGLENAQILRPGYAIEYDFFDPTQLTHSLESKVIGGLFMAGQVNGTTGYEEAAGQGLVAGINAALKVKGEKPFVLMRDEAYIGLLIDDLVTKGVDEPYRMFTSRAEYRILLRQDDADLRLTPLSYNIGLADKFRYEYTMKKYDRVSALTSLAESSSIQPSSVNDYLNSVSSTEIDCRTRISSLVSRPQVSFSEILNIVPRGTSIGNSIDKILDIDYSDIYEHISSDSSLTDAEVVLKSNTDYPVHLLSKNFIEDEMKRIQKDEIIDSAEVALKYKGYIERERQLADKIMRLEYINIPENFDFDKVESLSIECRQKLKKYSPRTIAQASRISGVSPADVSVLLVYFGR